MNVRIVTVAGLLLASATALSAHHDMGRLFDTSKLVTLRGTLTRVEWREPHVILRLETRRDDGSTTSWRIETRNPRGLAQAGVDRTSFAIGERLSATVCVAKDGTRWAVTREITRPGGAAMVGVGGC
jgi:hypothetical protein